jgi:hypothetical protein
MHWLFEWHLHWYFLLVLPWDLLHSFFLQASSWYQFTISRNPLCFFLYQASNSIWTYSSSYNQLFLFIPENCGALFSKSFSYIFPFGQLECYVHLVLICELLIHERKSQD